MTFMPLTSMPPMRLSSIFLPALALTLLSGCTVGKIVTAPIRVAGTAVETAVDATTQTQSEKEEDLGRRVLAERKKELNACLDRAETKAERKQCKDAYEDDGY
ncbi:DUF6726 family protein [Parasphingorhabdus sp.]|uniref:DUF6726 family protein n=1 Tax=Parasphingorhabdus sp. TaxID=2709688 RepID=UPI002F9272FC